MKRCNVIVDFSKIPSVCTFSLQNGVATEKPWLCAVREQILGRVISSTGRGDTAQEAVDTAVNNFLGVK